MGDLLQRAASFLNDKRHAHLTHEVTYKVGVGSVTLQATEGRTGWQVVDESGVEHTFESRDFLVRTADLIIGGSVVRPQAGHRIEDASSGETRVYEVMAPPGFQVYNESDPYALQTRIHTKKIA